MNKNIYMFGRQGSGKGIQSAFICKKYNYEYVSTGNLIRERIKKGDKYSNFLSDIINSGNLVDDNNLFKVFNEYFEQANKNRPFLFDGVPRNNTQLMKLDNMLKKIGFKQAIAIYLDIKKETSIKRIATRKICPQCAKVFDPTIKGFSENNCPKCKVDLVIRKDDQKESIIKRLEIFEKQTMPVIEKLEQQQRLYRINGEPPINEVSLEIAKKVFDEQ